MIWNPQSIRELERKSIRDFVERNKQYLTGRVLDFGAGKPGTCREPQPYRDLVSGEYVPVDIGDEWPIAYAHLYDAILCTQVLQYIPNPAAILGCLNTWLKRGAGTLVMTYAANWDEVEESDFWRFTKAGMGRLLRESGFTVISHERRAEIDLNGFKFPLGYGVVAQR